MGNLSRYSEREHIVLVFCLTKKPANSYCKPGALPRLTGVIRDLATCHREKTHRPRGSPGGVTLLQDVPKHQEEGKRSGEDGDKEEITSESDKE